MPIIRRLLVAGLLVTLAGCGSETAQQRDRSDVADLARVLHQYNAATVHDLAQQASICKSAWVQAQRVAPLNINVHGASLKQAALLDSARANAVTGFHDCASAAASLNYPAMVRAQAKLVAANTELSSARGKT